MSQKTSRDPGDTPAMRQYHRFKQQHPGCVLFFRMGDFYEMFHEDAELAHRVLGVTLTQRTEGVPMAGVPYHAVEGYLRRMIQAGHRVAVCDQVEDAAQAKGVVDRDVTRVITPGTLTDESLLEEGRPNPLAAVAFLGAGSEERGAGPGGEPASGGLAGAGMAVPTGKADFTEYVAIAWTELSTGDFQLATFELSQAVDELARIAPRELLVCENADGDIPGRARALADAVGCAAIGRSPWQFRRSEAVEALRKQFGVAQLSGFGLDEDDPALGAAGAVLMYLIETQCLNAAERQREKAAGNGDATTASPGTATAASSHEPHPLSHLQPPKRYRRDAHLGLDQATLRSLEIERTIRSGTTEGSLLATFRRCHTAMGKRTLRRWLCYPLRDREAIEARQSAVGAMLDDERFRRELGETLSEVQDVERISGRIAVQRATPRDLVALGRSAKQGRAVAGLLEQRPSIVSWHEQLSSVLDPLDTLASELAEGCVETPPAHLREGGLIRDGYDARLDEARSLQRDANDWLARYQKKLVEESRIDTLKVGYNKVFGYYIELTAANRAKVKDDEEPFKGWTRKQTLKNAERFITPELKEFESKVLSAEGRAIEREQALFRELCDRTRQDAEVLRSFAAIVAELDALCCFADKASRGGYVKPAIVNEPMLHIEAGRHPVLDETLGEGFVPNDVALGAGIEEQGSGIRHDTEDASCPVPDPRSPDPHPRSSASLALITGPNMAGKSTYIRQTALLTLLAHAGAFVPADAATIGLCDRIFTRIGAADELHLGQSTFMVEMTETANICHHATERSLVILDEIGRGTSTLDGLSLAWAIAEHLADVGCRTLFATHYHELTAMAEERANVANLHVTVREWREEVVFLHRIVPGATDRSYGIHVAKIAGLPPRVVARAKDLLSRLAVQHGPGEVDEESGDDEGNEKAGRRTGKGRSTRKPPTAMPLFESPPAFEPHPVVEELAELDLDRLTPVACFDLVRRWRERLDEDDDPDA